MSITDIVLLALFIPAIVRGISKGFIEQAFALFTIVVGGKLAFMFADKLKMWIGSFLGLSDTVLYIIAFIAIIVFAVLIFKICSSLITKLLEAVSLGWINRLLGFVMSILNTALVLGLLLNLFVDINGKIFHFQTNFLSESVIYGWIKAFTDFVFPRIEELFNTAKETVSI